MGKEIWIDFDGDEDVWKPLIMGLGAVVAILNVGSEKIEYMRFER